ncbi:hypothetical protein EG327_006172 [Venturia inaequalis]|uniref:Uncharacterized protein n=1 Tax=Venturia inaequalis TaxID=5025 RepID=A0A8H3ZEE5_VENIN|nr:hypothetical protein EG327_006172 [Venturia inaequalis]
MWSSRLISALLCGQLYAAALSGQYDLDNDEGRDSSSSGSSGYDLPRIRPRFPQTRGGLGKGKGFPGGGFGPQVEVLGTPLKGSNADPKGALAKPLNELASPSTNTPPQATDQTNVLEGALAALDTALSPPKATPDAPKPAGNTPGDTFAGLGTAMTPPPSATPGLQSPGNARPPDDPKRPGNTLGDALAAFGTALAPPTGIQVLTTEEVVKCREYPDNISPDSAQTVTLAKETSVRVTCWTSASIAGASGKVQGSSVWLRSEAGCFIPEMSIQADTNFEKKLGTCEPVHHFVGTMQRQYKRQDCYECTNTNCASKNNGSGYLIDLGCVTTGEPTGGNSTWVKHAKDDCFFPGAIFEPKGWLGSHAGGFYCAPGTGAAR